MDPLGICWVPTTCHCWLLAFQVRLKIKYNVGSKIKVIAIYGGTKKIKWFIAFKSKIHLMSKLSVG